LFVTPPYDRDGAPASYSLSERAEIIAIWRAIAEAYAPFDVDVTTEDPTLGPGGLDALRKTTTSDVSYGIRVCIGGASSDWLGAAAGGVAYVGSFGWATDEPVGGPAAGPLPLL
jgi:hypothetical protein